MCVLKWNAHVPRDGFLQFRDAFRLNRLLVHLHLEDPSVEHIGGQCGEDSVFVMLPGLHRTPDVGVVQVTGIGKRFRMCGEPFGIHIVAQEIV